MNSKIVNTYWFCNKKVIGIVTIENEVGTRKAYIASVPGRNEQEDVDFILNFGSRVYPGMLQDVLKGINME